MPCVFSKKMRFWQLSLRAYNSSLECSFSEVKVAFCSSNEGLSCDAFRSGVWDWLKSSKPKAYALRFFFSKNELFWQLSLRAHNSSLECSFSKVKVAFCSSKEGLSSDVFRSRICH